MRYGARINPHHVQGLHSAPHLTRFSHPYLLSQVNARFVDFPDVPVRLSGGTLGGWGGCLGGGLGAQPRQVSHPFLTPWSPGRCCSCLWWEIFGPLFLPRLWSPLSRGGGGQHLYFAWLEALLRALGLKKKRKQNHDGTTAHSFCLTAA